MKKSSPHARLYLRLEHLHFLSITKKALFNQPIGTPIGTAHLRKLWENNIAIKQLVQSPADEILKEKTNSELISELTASNHVIEKHKKESGSDSKGCLIQHKNECQNCKRIYWKLVWKSKRKIANLQKKGFVRFAEI